MTPAPLFAALCLSLGVLFALASPGGAMDLAGAVFLVVGGLWLGVCLPEPPGEEKK